MISKSGKNYFALISILLLLVFIYWCGVNVVWLGEDIAYSLRFDANLTGEQYYDSGEVINSLPDIFISLKNHYEIVNGRMIAHFFVHYFDAIGSSVSFSFLNTIIYLFLASLIVRISKVKIKPESILSALLLIILMMPTKMMPTTQVGYIWMPAIVIGFIIIFFNCNVVRYRLLKNPLRILMLTVAIIFGAIAGNSQETFSLPSGCALIAYCIMCKFRLSPMQWALLLGFQTGILLLALSPGSQANAANLSHFATSSLFNILLSLRAFYILIIILVWMIIRDRIYLRKFLKDNFFWLIAIGASFLFNIIINVYGYRQMLGIELFSIIIIMKILPGHTFSRPYMILTLFIFSIFAIYQIDRILTQSRQLSFIEQEISENPASPIIVDVWNIGYFTLIDYCSRIAGIGDYTDYYLWNLNKKYEISQGINPGIVIYPDSMVFDDDSIRKVNHVFRFNNIPDRFLINLSKANPPQIIARRKILGLIPYQSKSVLMRKLTETDTSSFYVPVDLSPLITTEGFILR